MLLCACGGPASPGGSFALGGEVRQLLSRLRAFCQAEGVSPYLVGGLVRDGLLGRPSRDLDLALAGDALAFARRLAQAWGGRFVLLDQERGVARVALPPAEAGGRPWHLDCAAMAGEDIAEDLARRDFTIDAMAVALADWEAPEPPLIDPCGGRRDLAARLVRVVSPASLSDDPARLLRAYRLAAELQFALEPGTASLIKQHAPLATRVAGERVREELLGLLDQPGASAYLQAMSDTGLLDQVFPELALGRGVAQPPEHHWDVYRHSLETVAALEGLLRQMPAADAILQPVPWDEGLAAYFQETVSGAHPRSTYTKLAALLHDIGKPGAKTAEDGGRIRFFGHPAAGADMARQRLERLRFSSQEADLVEAMVRHHLRPGPWGTAEPPSPRAVFRFFRDTGPAGLATCFLALADHLASRGPDLELAPWQEHAQGVALALARHREVKAAPARRAITGHDLLEVLGLAPGPGVGRLLSALEEAQAAGEWATREEALDWARRYLESGAEERQP